MGREGRALSPAGPLKSALPWIKEQPSALSQQACAWLLLGVRECLEVTAHVSPNDCVHVCGCDLEGISASACGAVSVSLSVGPSGRLLLTVERDIVEVLSHRQKVKIQGP